MQVNWNVFQFVISDPRAMIKATGRAVRGRLLQTSIMSFTRQLELACDQLTSSVMNVTDDSSWQNDQLLNFTARTMFDAIFNTVFGRDESAQFNSQLAYHQFQV